MVFAELARPRSPLPVWRPPVGLRPLARASARRAPLAKLVADCFKYRNKIGIDVAIEALREYLGKRGRSMAELQRAADVCRVGRVIRPYLEALA